MGMEHDGSMEHNGSHEASHEVEHEVSNDTVETGTAEKKKKPDKVKTPATKTKARPKETAAEHMAEPVPTDSALPMKWYVVHTYSGHENKVKENILKMINSSSIKDHFGRLIVATEEVAEMKKGKKTITTRKFFPSYILIEMYMTDESWHLVDGIPGVTSFVGTGAKPQPLLPNEVERILGRMDKERETILPEIPYTLGEHIRIKDGPFSDFNGVIDEINAEKGKLRILVSIFGRETPVELDFLQVESL
jgi:transcriptional antiterminator NusG